MRYQSFWLMLFVPMLIGHAVSAAETKFVNLGSAHGGPIVLHGHMLPDSVFRVEALVTIDGADTLWQQLYINDYATRRPVPPKPTATVQAVNRVDLEQEIASAGRDFVANSGKSISARGRIEFIADQYRQSSLVTSVRVAYDSSDASWLITICYAGAMDDCEGHRYNARAPITPPSNEDKLRGEANEILSLLRGDRMIFISRGPKYAPPVEQTEMFRQEVIALLNGKPVEESILPIPRLAIELKRPPISLEALKWEDRHD